MTFALGVVSRGWRDANTRGEKFQALLPALIGGVLRLGTSLGRILFPTQEVLALRTITCSIEYTDWY